MGKDYSTAASRLATSGWNGEDNFEDNPAPRNNFIRRYVAEDPPERRSFDKYYGDELILRPGVCGLFNSDAPVDLMAVMMEENYTDPGYDLAFYVDEQAQLYIENIEDAEDDGEAFESFILKALTDEDATDENIWLIGR